MMIACAHATTEEVRQDRKGNPRYRCLLCGKTWTDRSRQAARQHVRSGGRRQAGPAAAGRRHVDPRPRRASTGLDREHDLQADRLFGDACQRFLDQRMRGLTLDHLQFDEQWTYVAKKQSRLTMNEREESSEVGDIYLWTCIDQKTKLMPGFLIGKRSADNARRFMVDIAGRLVFPNAHASDAHSYMAGGYKPITQISTDCFNAYPEAVDLAFGPYVKFGTISKEYRNATMIYTPSEMVGHQAQGPAEHKRAGSPHDMHQPRRAAERHAAAFLEAAQPADLCFSKKLREPGSGFRHVRGLLQFLLADPDARQERQEAADGRDDGRDGRARLDVSTSCLTP